LSAGCWLAAKKEAESVEDHTSPVEESEAKD
jgi:hypothetical protein